MTDLPDDLTERIAATPLLVAHGAYLEAMDDGDCDLPQYLIDEGQGRAKAALASALNAEDQQRAALLSELRSIHDGAMAVELDVTSDVEEYRAALRAACRQLAAVTARLSE